MAAGSLGERSIREKVKRLEKTINDYFRENDESKDLTMMKLASRMKPDVLCDAARESGVYGQIAAAIVTEIEEQWVPSLGAALKARCKLSWDRYQRCMNIICQEWCPEKGKYVDRVLDSCGVTFPQMHKNCAKNKVKEFHHQLHKDLNIIIDYGEVGVGSDNEDEEDEEENVRKRARLEVERMRIPADRQLRKKLKELLGEKRIDQQLPLQIQLIIDSAKLHRGVNQTTATLKIVTYDCGDENDNKRETNNSPMNSKRVCMYEGDDNYDMVCTKCEAKRLY